MSGPRAKLWRELQAREWVTYQRKGAEGVFSLPTNEMACKVGLILSVLANSPVLDVGCGCLPRPAYMCPGLEWHGVDPFDCKTKPEFNRQVGIAEALPYPEASFASVLFATSLDHCLDPSKALLEARRVLRVGGLLFVWYSQRWGPEYEAWLKAARRGPALYKEQHMWAWNDASMNALLVKAGFALGTLHKLDPLKGRLRVAEKRT
jgi:SAM-dependent methyltransferase